MILITYVMQICNILTFKPFKTVTFDQNETETFITNIYKKHPKQNKTLVWFFMLMLLYHTVVYGSSSWRYSYHHVGGGGSEVMSFLCQTSVALGTVLLLLYGDMKAWSISCFLAGRLGSDKSLKLAFSMKSSLNKNLVSSKSGTN